VPRRGHRDGDAGDRGEAGIEPAAAALQVQLAPLAHASPCAVPTRIELAYRGRQPRILTRGFRDQTDAPRRARECWVCGGNRTLATRFTNSRATITLRTPCEGVPWRTRTSVDRSSGDCTCRCANGTGGSEPGNRTLRVQCVGLRSPPGDLLARYRSEPRHTNRVSRRSDRRGKPGDRTLRVRHMKPTSPPGELLAALAGRRGVEPRWSELETDPIPDRSLAS
jgi:hypothetical protein